MGRYYILQDGQVIEEPDYDKWARWRQDCYEKVRCIAQTEAQYGTVRTVFLAVNMTLAQDDPPCLFETRVEGGWLNDQWQRYPTLVEAKAGHEAWVARVRESDETELPPPGCTTW
jgi:hypothetical protein